MPLNTDRPRLFGRAAVAAGVALLIVVPSCTPSPAAPSASAVMGCPVLPPGNAPKVDGPVNIDLLKRQLRDYHDGMAYEADLRDVYVIAEGYVNGRSGKVTKPAVVLDIDETLLSNWRTFVANDFGFFPKAAACTIPSNEACGFNIWIDRAEAEALAPALSFFNAVKANVAIFLVTGRREAQRAVTLKNLERAGYRSWSELVTRPDGDTDSSVTPFKTKAREKIQADGYTILANIGDQLSDLDGGRAAECPFKLPNPFYFIK
jgi:hypothetical protein